VWFTAETQHKSLRSVSLAKALKLSVLSRHSLPHPVGKKRFVEEWFCHPASLCGGHALPFQVPPVKISFE
jgi:hypothetical protein